MTVGVELVIDHVPVDLLLRSLKEAVQGNLDEEDHLSHREFSRGRQGFGRPPGLYGGRERRQEGYEEAEHRAGENPGPGGNGQWSQDGRGSGELQARAAAASGRGALRSAAPDHLQAGKIDAGTRMELEMRRTGMTPRWTSR